MRCNECNGREFQMFGNGGFTCKGCNTPFTVNKPVKRRKKTMGIRIGIINAI